MKKNKSGSTTESYSSVLQDEDEEGDEVDEEEGAETAEEDAQCDNGDILRDLLTDIANGNHLVKLSPTDSESFTTSEQLMTQRFVDIYVTDKSTSSD